MFKGLGDNRWIVFVLPGFIALFVAGFVSDFPEVRDVFIPFVYVALTAISVAVPLAGVAVVDIFRRGTIAYDKLHQTPWFVGATFATAIVIGFLFGLAHSTDVVSKILRDVFGKNSVLVSSHTEAIRLLFREAYRHDFIDEFDGIPPEYISDKERQTYVEISYGEGAHTRKAYGVVHSYFGGSERPQVYLSPACREIGGAVAPVKGPGLWVNLEQVIEVAFEYQACSRCAAALKADTGHGGLTTSCPFD